MSEQIVLKQTLSSLAGNTISEDVPYDGEVTEVVIDFPLGCNALVDIAVGHGNQRITPRAGYIALDNTNFKFVLSRPGKIYRREQLWADMENGDSANSHTISVIFTIAEKK